VTSDTLVTGRPASAMAFEVKLRQVLARKPLPELLLISNRCD